jgi:predicted nucleic acid-binding protein
MNTLNDYKVVVGGSKMKAEMMKKEKLLRLISSYSVLNRVISISNNKVDDKAEEISEATGRRLGAIPKECDDFHILALALISKCQNIITHDRRLSTCVGKIRTQIGHALCPNLRNIQSEDIYIKLKSKGQL